jgi:hypothetical protein
MAQRYGTFGKIQAIRLMDLMIYFSFQTLSTKLGREDLKITKFMVHFSHW